MKINLSIKDQPLQLIKRQPPAVRRRLRKALHSVANGALFPEPLEDELDGFYKIKVDRYRLMLQATSAKAGSGFRLIFAEQRKAVYEMFSQMFGLE